MAMQPRPRAPKEVAYATSDVERRRLEQDWAQYRSQMAHLDKMDAASQRAQTAQQQRDSQAAKGNAEIEAIRRRVERQEKGKSTWEGMAGE